MSQKKYRCAIRVLGYKLPSTNVYMAMHSQVKKRARAELAGILKIEALTGGGLPAEPKRRRVKADVLFGPGERLYDADNCSKLLLDAMKDAGLIVNDSPKWVVADVYPVRAIQSGLDITVEDVSADVPCAKCKTGCRPSGLRFSFCRRHADELADRYWSDLTDAADGVD